MRVYVPTTVQGLQALRDNGFGPTVAAYAVTGALREWYAEGEADELEYAASDDAARACLDLLAAAPGGPARRVVVAADVPEVDLRVGGRGRSSVQVLVPVTLELVASVHVDDDEAVADVAAAIQAMAAADAGDEQAQLRVEDAAGNELLWYDVSELDELLQRLSASPPG